MNKKNRKVYKVLLLGYECVGKTCVVDKYMCNTFKEATISTMGVDTINKTFNINNNKNLEFKIYDTAGQINYINTIKVFIKIANGIILIYDITNKYTF